MDKVRGDAVTSKAEYITLYSLNDNDEKAQKGTLECNGSKWGQAPTSPTLPAFSSLG